MSERRSIRVLFLVEGFTDIRFVVGLSEICDLTMAVPRHAYESSGLKTRVAASSARLTVIEIVGGRLAFQALSLTYLWRTAREFDVILSQEMLRGSFNATLIGALKGVPVVMYTALPALEYFRCRRDRKQIGALTAWMGEAVIRTLVALNSRLATSCVALGPYLRDLVARSCRHTELGYYYGVDTRTFRPSLPGEQAALRRRLDIPPEKFLIVLASRISHEKDPETVLHAVAGARARGLDAVLLNLGGGYLEFIALAKSLGLPDASGWVLGRPAAHPMYELADYYRAADALVQGSLAEGLGLSPLEALACEVPVIASAVGGMAAHLSDFAELTPRRDIEAMTQAILRIAADTPSARARARLGREYVCREWNRERAFSALHRTLTAVADGEAGRQRRAAA